MNSKKFSFVKLRNNNFYSILQTPMEQEDQPESFTPAEGGPHPVVAMEPE